MLIVPFHSQDKSQMLRGVGGLFVLNDGSFRSTKDLPKKSFPPTPSSSSLFQKGLQLLACKSHFSAVLFILTSWHANMAELSREKHLWSHNNIRSCIQKCLKPIYIYNRPSMWSQFDVMGNGQAAAENARILQRGGIPASWQCSSRFLRSNNCLYERGI